MQTSDHRGRTAGQPAPGIDELSARLSALATRIDTLNGGRRAHGGRDSDAGRSDKLDTGTEARHWPRLPVPGEPPPPSAVELAEQADRIAELTAIRDRQAEELRNARDHLERQALALKGMRELASERDSDVAELTRRLLESEADKVELESKLAGALRDAANSTMRLSAHEGTLNNCAADLVAANQLVEELRGSLAAAQVAVATQVLAAEERLQQRFDGERSTLIANAERRLDELHAAIAERDSLIANHEQDKASLAEEIAMLRALLDDSHAELTVAVEAAAGKESQITFLDTVLKVTRENAEATVKELAAEFDRERAGFQREREELIIKAKTASAFQKDIAQLLPRLLDRRAAA